MRLDHLGGADCKTLTSLLPDEREQLEKQIQELGEKLDAVLTSVKPMIDCIDFDPEEGPYCSQATGHPNQMHLLIDARGPRAASRPSHVTPPTWPWPMHL